MFKKISLVSFSLLAVCLLSVPARALDLTAGLKTGNLELTSAGPISFGPQGILFVGDTKAAQVCAIDTGDTKGNPEKASINVKGLNQVIASLLGTEAADVMINDLAVNPASGNTYVSASSSRGPDARPALLRVRPAGPWARRRLGRAARLDSPPRLSTS